MATKPKKKPAAPVRRKAATKAAKKAPKRPAAKPARPERRQAESLRLRNISPTLTVRDIRASVAWYRDVVGFFLKETWERDGKMMGAELVAGSEGLVLTQDDWAQGRDRVKGVGMRLYLSTAQSVDEIAANIKARGGKLASEPADTPWGTRAFTLADPDGFKFTIAREV